MPRNHNWTWVHALHKELICQMPAERRSEFALSIYDLELLFKAQDGKCALSGRTLFLPPYSSELPRGMLWSNWVDTLGAPYRVNTPMLVRVADDGFWMTGNVFFITRGMKELYLGSGYSQLRRECEAVLNHQLIIPTLGMLTGKVLDART